MRRCESKLTTFTQRVAVTFPGVVSMTNSNTYIEPIIDFVNLRAFADYIISLAKPQLSAEYWDELVNGVLKSDVEDGNRFEYNLFNPSSEFYSNFASERGHDFHRVHVQIYCADWMALKISTVSVIMANYRLEHLTE